MADIVIWPIWSFGAKPRMIVKGGLVSWALMGDPNASLPTPQPIYYRPMFGAMGLANQARPSQLYVTGGGGRWGFRKPRAQVWGRSGQGAAAR